MDLIDDQDAVLRLAGLIDHILHAALELSAELRSGNHSRHVQKIHGHVHEFLRHFSICDLHRKTLGNSRLTDTRLTDQGRIILGTAV